MKRFVLLTILYSLPIVTPLIIFGLCVAPHLHGDIGRLGYITFPDKYGKYDLPIDNKVINCGYNYCDLGDSCIFVIGDSFSQTNKTDISYLYFLAENIDYKVVNLHQQWYINPFARFIYMSKTNIMPEIVIVESVERYLIERLCDINITLSPNEMVHFSIIDTVAQFVPSSKSFLESAQEWSKRKLHLKGYENPIKKSTLSTNYFSCTGKENQLFFYEDDIKNVSSPDSLMQLAMMKLDSLFLYADSIGIDLYVLIAADKYDVYQYEIIDNVYPPKKVLEQLTTMYNHPNLINSKDTLAKLVDNHVQDIYWCNDTHWGVAGCKAVAVQIENRINAIE